jgi:serine/threonine protein kinase
MAAPTARDLDDIQASLAQRGYNLMAKIGAGQYGSVFTIRSVKFDLIYVVKVLDKQNEEGEDITSEFESEVHTLISLVHPNIVAVYDFFSSDKYHYVILEYCDNGSLADFIATQPRVTEPVLRDLARGLVQALAYLHSQEFCHRDIKPANILIDKHGRLKLADFGFASSVSSASRFCGSLAYMAPEMVRRNPNVNPAACDVWAMGITLYELAIGSLPWTRKSTSGLTREILSETVPLGGHVPKPLGNLLRKMLEPNAGLRPSAQELLEMPFFESARLATPVSLTGTVGQDLVTVAALRDKPRRLRRVSQSAVALPILSTELRPRDGIEQWLKR